MHFRDGLGLFNLLCQIYVDWCEHMLAEIENEAILGVKYGSEEDAGDLNMTNETEL